MSTEQRTAGSGKERMNTAKQEQPSQVRRAKQDGETPAKYSWVEASAWTARMLEALERGVRGGVWFSLIDKVYRIENLQAAYERVKRNRGSAGVDYVSVDHFGENLSERLREVSDALKDGNFRATSIRRTYIPKAGGGKRPLGIPTVKDRVVQAAIKQVIEPIMEHEFLSCSYGFRPNRGCKDALREVDELMRKQQLFVLDADIRRYFDTINHEKLMGLVEKRIQDGRVLELIKQFLKQGILEQGEYVEPASEGTPQGGVLSTLLANVYLHELDTALCNQGFNLVRYADDFVVLCETEQRAHQALDLVQAVLGGLSLELHPDKTHIVDMRQPGNSFEFLGYKFKNHKGRYLRYPRHKSILKLREAIRQKTPRKRQGTMESISKSVNQTLTGWYEYFKNSSSFAFNNHDGWVRMRFRAILCRRTRSSSRRYGSAHNRWKNEFFSNTLGVFSLVAAHHSERVQPV
jgi:RNA-directed DNA polymerase